MKMKEGNWNVIGNFSFDRRQQQQQQQNQSGKEELDECKKRKQRESDTLEQQRKQQQQQQMVLVGENINYNKVHRGDYGYHNDQSILLSNTQQQQVQSENNESMRKSYKRQQQQIGENRIPSTAAAAATAADKEEDTNVFHQKQAQREEVEEEEYLRQRTKQQQLLINEQQQLKIKQQEQQQQRLQLINGTSGISGNNGNKLATKLASQRGKQPEWSKDDREVNLSFCGCGFLGIYHVGVASCFHQYAPQLSMQKISGSSAGALVAMAHICGDLQLAYCTTDILAIAIEARSHTLGSFHPSFDIQAQVRESLERGLPDDAYLKASGKLHVSLTRVEDGENVIVSEFDSNEDLIQVLLCSCFIPFWSGIRLPKFKNVAYIDGGFSNNLLILNEKTVTVSPFAGEADICPQDDTLNLLQISLSNTSFSISPSNLYRVSHALLPPEPEILSDLCRQGFADGIRYLQRMNLISCTKCLEIRSSLLVLTDGEDIEEVFSSTTTATATTTTTAAAVAATTTTTVATNHHHQLDQQQQQSSEIILQQHQDQELIEIGLNGGGSGGGVVIDSHRSRRNSLVSITSTHRQIHHSATTTTTTTTNDGNNNLTPAVSLYNLLNGVGDNDDDDDDYHEEDSSLNFLSNNNNCNDCVLIRQRAMYDPLPKLFSDRIRDASEKVNKSLTRWLYSHRPVKYLSYLMAPYYIPVDLTFAIIYRFWKKLPLIRAELTDCLSQVLDFLLIMLKRMQSRSTSALLMGFSNDWEEQEEAIRYEKKKKIDQSQSLINHSKQDNNNNNNHYQHHNNLHHHHHHRCSSNKNQQLDHRDLNTHNHSHSHHQTKELHSLEDTFDSIVDVTSNQEARIFAYYFRDAKNRLQVTEIFDLERASSSNLTESNSSSICGSLQTICSNNSNNNSSNNSLTAKQK